MKQLKNLLAQLTKFCACGQGADPGSPSDAGGGGEGSNPISSFKTEQGHDHLVAIEKVYFLHLDNFSRPI